MRVWHRFGLVAVAIVAAGAALGVWQHRRLETGMVPPPMILRPQGQPTSVNFLISDATGWTDADRRAAEALVTEGGIAIGIDLPDWLAHIERGTGCAYLVADLERISQQVQDDGTGFYLLPNIAGVGAGGGMAMAIAAQTPASTIGATIAVDPVPGVGLSRPLCTQAARTETAGGTVYDLTEGPLPDPMTVLLTKSAAADGRAHAEALRSRWPEIAMRDTGDAPAKALTNALLAQDAAEAAAGVHGLPVTVLDTVPTRDTMAIVLSGDGGWRDLDKTIGERFRTSGVPTLGLDSLRYFWSEKTVQQTADDLSRLIVTYRGKWQVGRVILVGYSFGADVLPSVLQAMDPAHREAVTQVSLLGLSGAASFRISAAGWLGWSSDGPETLPELRKFDLSRVQCFYGKKDADSVCADLRTTPAMVVETDGGHHFDGDYNRLADLILQGPAKGTAP